MRNKLFKIIVLAILIIGIIPFLYLSFFSQPIADDFAFASNFKQNEYFTLIKNTYLKWGGRYSSQALIYLNPISFNKFFVYRLIPLLLILTTGIILYKLASIIFNVSTKRKVILSLVFLLLFLGNLPKISEQIYWYTGAVIYHIGLLFFMVYFILTINIMRKKYILNKSFTYIITLATLFIVMGFNEGLSILTFIFVCTLSLINWKNGREKAFFATQTIFSLLFLILILIAPGNFERIAVYPKSSDLIHSTIYSIMQTGRFSLKWIFSLPMLLASILFVFRFTTIKHWINLIPIILNRWTVLILLFIPLFICSFLPYWATGILGQHRTINLAWFFFLPIWFITLYIWLNHYNLTLTLSKKTHQLITIIFLVSIFTTGNGYHALKDIFSGAANNYKSVLDSRHQKIQTSSEETIIVQPISNPPKTLFVLDVSEDPNYWINQAYNVYFETNTPIKIQQK